MHEILISGENIDFEKFYLEAKDELKEMYEIELEKDVQRGEPSKFNLLAFIPKSIESILGFIIKIREQNFKKTQDDKIRKFILTFEDGNLLELPGEWNTDQIEKALILRKKFNITNFKIVSSD